MSVYMNVLNAVLEMINSIEPPLYSEAIIGALPTDNGICAMVSSGGLNTFADKTAAAEITIVVNAKNAIQQTAFDALGQIHSFLNMKKQYPINDSFQITNIETNSAPSYIGREQNKQWLCGSSLLVKFYLRGA